ncbi:SRPBCC family protein [Streptomyces sp. XM4011]|uniref:Ribosome association toxin PasT (RatA) of the RatAB toxin-antitoxin module n=1 Tax=Streptomyces harbinensis TaxID=1176198 RepID=A0A1I6W3F6_9ACTN|nr:MULTISPECIES: SRPBCC family protein [Streptomyces]MCK1813747.1 SRPBCC family protein [Streptomyces sp. XM4011]QKV71029.1 SRPBCC family protein [Streptomyces harbinensis]SFT20526.1 Ribosome association toxin PasT (RatA) of the RatAB toxin-antitoxin module [Streptomyces harbinensis]
MPHVEVNLPIKAPAAEAWTAVTRLEDYAGYMENVESVTVIGETASGTRTSEWSVLLKGSVLEWVEVDTLDHDSRVMSFDQISGDLDVFTGYWRVDRAEDDTSVVTFSVEFEIGIPLLADMLNPVATKALRENAEHMLQAIERRITALS